MADIISDIELAAWLETEVTGTISLIASKASDLVLEHWVDPVDPVPAYVWALAMGVAARAAANPKGLTSWTKSWDDITVTERNESPQRGSWGLYLTADEILALNGGATSPVATIRTRTRDQMCDPTCL